MVAILKCMNKMKRIELYTMILFVAIVLLAIIGVSGIFCFKDFISYYYVILPLVTIRFILYYTYRKLDLYIVLISLAVIVIYFITAFIACHFNISFID